MDRRDIVVIGASAGGFAAVRALIRPLAADFPAALFLVSHLPRGRSRLAEVIGKASNVSVRFAADGDTIRPGTLFIAPPDRHLLLQREQVLLSRGPRENLWRPSIDVLFRSAAVSFSSRTIGIVLSGVLDDGASGLNAIPSCASRACPRSCRCGSMARRSSLRCWSSRGRARRAASSTSSSYSWKPARRSRANRPALRAVLNGGSPRG